MCDYFRGRRCVHNQDKLGEQFRFFKGFSFFNGLNKITIKVREAAVLVVSS